MYFDLQDAHPDIDRLQSAISRREGVLLSIIAHLLLTIAVLLGPRIPFIQQLLQERAARAASQQEEFAALEAARERDSQRFVFVAPRIDTVAPAPPPIAELSDLDREARTVERSPVPTNPLPFARGDSSNRVEAEPEVERAARGSGDGTEPAAGPGDADPNAGEGERTPDLAPAPLVLADATASLGKDGRGASGAADTGGGMLGDALRNLSQVVRAESFDNRAGGDGQFGPSIQFDTKGVEFGPWIRRFIAQIKRNWFIPYAAMVLKGHVVLTFNVHKNGSITDLQIMAPSSVDAFNNSAFNALTSSNPTQALPPEYPSPQAFFTVTFYYNESPDGR